MKKMKTTIAWLLLTALLFSLGACTFGPQTEENQTSSPSTEKEQQGNTEEESPPDFLLPLPVPEPVEQATPSTADLMMQRLKANIGAAQWAAIRLRKQDVQTKIDITPQLLEEIAYLLCQDYTVLTTPLEGGREMESEIMFQVKQPEGSSIVQVFKRRDEDGNRDMIAWVQEGEIVAQYAYDYEVFQALEEAIENNEYENEVELDGEYVRVRSKYDMEAFPAQKYTIGHFYQFDETLLYCYSANNSQGSSFFELIDGTTGKSLNHFEVSEQIVSVEATTLEEYDFRITTPTALYYYNAQNPGQTMTFQLPENVAASLTGEGKGYEALFDYNTVNNLLVYISEEGVVLSNRDGARNDILLRHDRLPQALEKAGVSVEEEAQPRYTEPRLLGGGKILVCPITVPGSEEAWVGVTVFYLNNGLYRDYISDFAPGVKSFSYPDDVSLLAHGQDAIVKLDVVTGAFSLAQIKPQVGDEVYFYDMESIITLTQDMNYNGELLLQKQSNPRSQRVLLNVKGDYFSVVGVSQNYVMCRYADIYGTRMILVRFE